MEIPDVGRDDLPGLFAELGFKVGAEIGVEQGLYSEVLCWGNPGLKLYCVDAWQCYPGYRVHVSQDKLDGFYQATQERLAGYDVVLVRAFSVEAARGFERGSLDFVYLDSNHALPQVIADLAAWLPVVRVGGIIAGHDYRKSKNRADMHVVHAVQAWTEAYKVRPWFVLGRKDARPGEVRDKNRSWMWVKS